MAEKILYVEDDPDIQIVARLALERIGGFTVKVCSSGREALQQAEAFAPDLVLLDVMMPEMTGPQTLLALRQLPGLARVPMVFVTAKTQKSEVENYLQLGVVGVISKPFDPMKLAATVRSYLERGRNGAPRA
ncbi:MAG: response regulator [Deltaproteobacteria bacterium]|nr:response regulator [Deltaproteobacteria bacterium]